MARIFRFWLVAWFGSLVAVVVAMSSMTIDCHLSLNRARNSVAAFASALESFRAKEGHYPGESTGLSALVPTYLRRLGEDSWGNPYIYRQLEATSTPLVYSKGADGIDSLGHGDDVIPGPKKYRCEDYGINCPPTFFELIMKATVLLFLASTLIGIARTLTWCARKLSQILD